LILAESATMNQENGRSTTRQAADPFNRKFEYRRLWLMAVVGTLYGTIVATVLAANPTAITFVKYVAPACATLGVAVGTRYGFFFNVVNHCKRGSILWAMIGGILAAAGGTLAVALMAVLLGSLAGFAAGWVAGSFLPSKQREFMPLVGTGIGAIIQAGWTEPMSAMKIGGWGGAVGAVAGPLFLLLCAALSYFVLRRTGPR
jgi:hypothetical protein